MPLDLPQGGRPGLLAGRAINGHIARAKIAVMNWRPSSNPPPRIRKVLSRQ